MGTDSEPLLIWGAGAMGGTIGAFLARSGIAVTLVDRVSEHVSVMNSQGLTIKGPVDGFTVPVTAVQPDRLTGRFSRVLLCVKGQDTESATRMLEAHLTADGYVASIQNGLNEDTIASIVGRGRTIGAFINFGADYHGPGEILYGARSSVVVGELDGVLSPRVQALAELLCRFEPEAIATDNIHGFLWSKLAYCSLLWANALVDAELNELFGSREYRPMLTELTREVVRIAERRGTRLEAFSPFDPSGFVNGSSPAEVDRAFERIFQHRKQSAKKHSGMWRDIAVRKRRTEADALLVPVIDTATREGIATPLNSAMLGMIRDLEEGRRQQDFANFDELVSLLR